MENNKEKKNVSASKTGDKKSKRPSKLTAFFKSRKTKRGMISIVLTVLFVAVIVGLNILSMVLTNSFPALTTDLTANKVFKLTDESVEQISKLDKNVTAYVLSPEEDLEAAGGYYTQVNRLLREFEKYSKHLTLEYVDLEQEPGFAVEFPEVNWYSNSALTSPFIIVEHKDNYIAVTSQDVFTFDEEAYTYYGEYVENGQKLEQALLTAILNVTTEDKVSVTFIETGALDPTPLVSLLSNNAYDVNTISLLSDEIPEESQFVVLFAPMTDIDTNAYNALSKWLYNDGEYGHSLVYIPNFQATDSFQNINSLLEEWSMSVSKNLVYESDTQYMTLYYEPYYYSCYTYENTEFTANLKDSSTPVVLGYCMPIELLGTNATSLLSTSTSAVKFPLDVEQMESWNPDEAEPQKLNGAAISTQGNEDNTKSSNVIVIGSYMAFSNDLLSTSSANNSAYFLNIFNSIAERDSVSITIEGKVLDSQELGLGSVFTQKALIIIVRYIIPAAVIIVGIVMWIRRRHK